MTRRSEVAPDLVIVGAARSGTSFLGATLARHPGVDGGKVKEPNYFSSRWDDGPDWYEHLFQPRSVGAKRLDASVSYTYPQHPRALERIRDVAPDVQVVYTVREPLARLVSHFQLFRYYLAKGEKWPDLGTALATSAMFLGAGDYGHWLARLSELFPVEQLLVVPFPVLTSNIDAPVGTILSRLGLAQIDQSIAAPSFRNDARAFRSPVLRRAHRALHRSGLYPAVRTALGAERLRRFRGTVTRQVELPSTEQELATLTEAQQADVSEHAANARRAVSDWLLEQDARLGVAWSGSWSAHVAAAAE